MPKRDVGRESGCIEHAVGFNVYRHSAITFLSETVSLLFRSIGFFSAQMMQKLWFIRKRLKSRFKFEGEIKKLT